MRETQEQNLSEKNGLISLSEASRLYGFSHGYLKILIHRGKLEAFKNGRNWFTTKEYLDKYLDTHRKTDVVFKSESVKKISHDNELKNSEVDVLKKIASNFSSDIVKELQELREAIKPSAVSKEELKVTYVESVKINPYWFYFKNCLVSGLVVFLILFSFSQISFLPSKIFEKKFSDKYLSASVSSDIFKNFPSDIPIFYRWLTDSASRSLAFLKLKTPSELAVGELPGGSPKIIKPQEPRLAGLRVDTLDEALALDLPTEGILPSFAEATEDQQGEIAKSNFTLLENRLSVVEANLKEQSALTGAELSLQKKTILGTLETLIGISKLLPTHPISTIVVQGQPATQISYSVTPSVHSGFDRLSANYLNLSNNAEINGSLTVKSGGTFNSLSVSGATTLTGATTIGGTLNVAGNTTLANATINGIFTAPNVSLTNASTTYLTVSNTSWIKELFTTQNLSVATTSAAQALTVQGNQFIYGGLGVGIATTTNGAIQTSGDVFVGRNLRVAGNSTTIGGSSADTLTVNSSVNSSLVPNQNNFYNLGSPAFYWGNLYVDTVNANNISGASTTISGTQSKDFTINSDNTSVDQENMNLIFFRGTVPPNAVITWNSATTSKRFEFNQAARFFNESASTTNPVLTVQGNTGLTANAFQVLDVSTTTALFSVNPVSQKTTMVNASTTNLTVSGNAWINNLTVSGAGGAVLLPDGTVGAPSLAFTSDTNTGLFRIGDGKMSFATNATTSLTLDTGKVIVGNDLFTASYQLEVADRDANNNTIVDELRLSHFTTGTAQNGLGTGLLFYGQDAEGAGQNLARVAAQVEQASSSAGFLSRLIFSTVGGGGLLEKMRITGNGQLLLATTTIPSGYGMNIATSTNIFGKLTVGTGTIDILSGNIISNSGQFNITNAANTALTFSTNNSERMRINESGNVGIGTTTPASQLSIVSGSATRVPLAVYGAASQSADLFQVATSSAATAAFVITSAGQVGIGTAGPARRLHVKDPGIAQTSSPTGYRSVVIIDQSTDNAGLMLGAGASVGIISSNSTGHDLAFYTSDAGTFTDRLHITSGGGVGIGTTGPVSKLTIGTAPSASHTGGTGVEVSSAFNSDVHWGTMALYSTDAVAADKGGKLVFGGTYTGTTDTTWAGISGLKENATDGQYGGYLSLWSRTNGQNLAERVRIDASGNVGIGTTTPGSLLHISSAVTGGTGFRVGNTDTGGRVFQLMSTGTGNSEGAGKLLISDITAAATRVTMDSSGNVGIGTTSPTAPLHILGTTNNSDLIIDNSGTRGGSLQFSKSATNYGAVGISGKIEGNASTDIGIFANSVGGGLRFYVNGSGNAVAVINSSGNVGIGTTSPTDVLHIQRNVANSTSGITVTNAQGSGYGASLNLATDILTAGRIYAESSEANTSEMSFWTTVGGTLARRMVIDKAGNVGIGTTGPARALDVNGIIQSRSAGAGGGAFYFDNAANFWRISQTVAGSTGKLQFTQDAVRDVMTLDNNGNVGIGTTNPLHHLMVLRRSTSTITDPLLNLQSQTTGSVDGDSFILYGTQTANWSAGVDQADGQKFKIEPTSSLGSTAALTIQTDGNVGIGTTSPGKLLTLSANGSGSSMVQMIDTQASGLSYYFANGVDGAGVFNIRDPDGAVITLKSGNVGIGTTSPSDKLHVSGGPNDGITLEVSSGELDMLFQRAAASIGLWRLNATNDLGLFVGDLTTEDVTIKAAGRVGIGDTDPSRKLSFLGSDGATTINSTANFISLHNSGAFGSGAAFRTGISFSGTNTSVGDSENATIEMVNTTNANNDNYVTITQAGSAVLRVTSNNSGDPANMKVVMNGTQTTVGLCHATNGLQTTPDEIVDCSGAPSDIAEWYDTMPDVEPGDILALSQTLGSSFNYSSGMGDVIESWGAKYEEVPLPGATTSISVLTKSTSPYQHNLLGIVSTAPYQTFGEDVKKTASHPQRIALIGRVPVKVSTESGPIAIGDRITSSSIPGTGMKATKDGVTVGIALESFDPSTSSGQAASTTIINGQEVKTGKVLVFVNLGQPQLASSASLASLDLTSITSDLNLDGHSLLNVKSITGMNGLWKIDEGGNIMAQSVETQKLTIGGGVASGVTIYNRTTGQPKCIYIDGESDAIRVSTGACGATQPSPEATAGTATNAGTEAVITNTQSPNQNPEQISSNPAFAEASAGTQTATTTSTIVPIATTTLAVEPILTATTTPIIASAPEPVIVSTTTPEMATSTP